MKKDFVSIVLPCYNPPLYWKEHIVQSLAEFKKHCPDFELIIVDDGFKPLNQVEIDYLSENVPNFTTITYPQNQGKGYAIRQGVAAAKGNIIIYTDIDFPYTSESFLKVYKVLHSGKFDIAVGVKDKTYYNNVPFLRKGISKILRGMIRRLIKLSITDTQCGLKGLTADAKHLLLTGTIDRYLFDLEFIYRAENKGLRLSAIPITLRNGVEFSQVKWSIIRGELRNFLRIMRAE